MYLRAMTVRTEIYSRIGCELLAFIAQLKAQVSFHRVRSAHQCWRHVAAPRLQQIANKYCERVQYGKHHIE
jgi:hypothetical protein